MKIQTFINILIRLLKVYQKAYDEKYDSRELCNNSLHRGFCRLISDISEKQYWTFTITLGNHYRHFFIRSGMNGGYLFPKVGSDYKNLLPRIEFLKSEIKRLEMLKGRGYTHI